MADIAQSPADAGNRPRAGVPRGAEPRAETVGSLLRSPAVARAARRASLADRFVLDEAARDAIMLQEEIGLDVITDGEVRRVSWDQTPRFLDAFATVPGGDGPVVVRRAATAPRTGDMAAEFAFLARHARARAKFTMPAPSYHRRYWSPEHSRGAYGSCEEFLTEIRDFQREVVSRLLGLGCDYIQLDAPNYASYGDPGARARLAAAGRDPGEEMAFDASLDSSLLAGLPPGVITAMHICAGHGGARPAPGGYRAISGALFPALGCSRLLLEYDGDRPGGLEALRDVRPGTIAVLGLADPAPRWPGDEDLAAERVREAARRKPLEELAVSTRCGFAPAAGGGTVTPDVQRATLELVVSLARRFWKDP
jgi:5-methyltetrahydropteroyltriglutamate--homocysteine methyltransferase